MSEKTLITDYKLSILFLLDSVKVHLTNGQICDVLLENLFSNYFLLQQALGELTESGFVYREGAGSISYFYLTDEGRESIPYLEKELSSMVRRAILERAHALGLDTDRPSYTLADYDRLVTGSYTVRLRQIEGRDTVMDISLSVPNQEAAKAICDNWQLRASKVYELLMDTLL